jgi:hypothetical protein
VNKSNVQDEKEMPLLKTIISGQMQRLMRLIVQGQPGQKVGETTSQ